LKKATHRELAARVREMAALAQAGLPVPFDRLLGFEPSAGPFELSIGCTLRAARSAGAPVSDVLGRLAQLSDRMAGHKESTAQAIAGPRMARRIIVFLPALAVPLTWVLGFDTVGVLFGSVVGWFLLALATMLTYAGSSWSRSMIQRAVSMPTTPGLYPRLLGLGVSAGVGISRSRDITHEALTAAGLVELLDPAEISQTEKFVEQSAAAGISVSAGLRALDVQCVDLCLHAAAIRVRELGERLLLPLGVCTLPAFLTLAVVPAVISIISSTRLGL
jgi:tight adherence protein B